MRWLWRKLFSSVNIWWEKYMTKKMFSQLLEKNCGRARGGNLNYTCLPGTKCLDYHIYHIMLWTPEQVIWVKCSLFFWKVYSQLKNCTTMFTIGSCQWWNSKKKRVPQRHIIKILFFTFAHSKSRFFKRINDYPSSFSPSNFYSSIHFFPFAMYQGRGQRASFSRVLLALVWKEDTNHFFVLQSTLPCIQAAWSPQFLSGLFTQT